MQGDNRPILTVRADEIIRFWNGESPPRSTWIRDGLVEIEKNELGTVIRVIIKRVIVREDLIIEGQANILPDLALYNCSLANCKFISANLSNISIQESTVGDIVYKDSNIQDIIILNSTTGSLGIRKSTVQNLELDNSNLKDFRIESSKCNRIGIFNSRIRIFKVQNYQARLGQNQNITEVENIVIGKSKIGVIKILDGAQTGGFQFRNSKTGKITFEKSIVQSFRISDDSKTEAFYINSSEVPGHIIIESSNMKGVWISQESKLGDIKILKSTLGYCSIESSHIDDLRFSHSLLPHITISQKSTIGHFQCFLALLHPAQIILNNVQFSHLDFDESVLPEFATVHLSDCSVNKLSFSNFCNFGAVFFSDLQAHNEVSLPSTIHFVGSDLGKMQFINCDLTKFERFEFSNTKMLDVFVAGSKMPESSAFHLPPNITGDVEEQKRLAYGQFKKIYEGQGDTAGSLRYLAFEMEAYRRQLELNKTKASFFSKERWITEVNGYCLT